MECLVTTMLFAYFWWLGVSALALRRDRRIQEMVEDELRRRIRIEQESVAFWRALAVGPPEEARRDG